MRLQLGAGPRPFDGFVNIDPRPGPGIVRGEAHRLPYADGTVEMIFSNAMFEHIYLVQQMLAVKEWARVLTPDGVAVVLGLPDFEMIARLYLARASGVKREVFDAFEVYRYTHGFPEATQPADWVNWSSVEHLNDAPVEWLPQLHKGIFDARGVRELCDVAGLQVAIWRYCSPGEVHPLSLAVLAGHRMHDLSTLMSVPHLRDFVDVVTLDEVAA